MIECYIEKLFDLRGKVILVTGAAGQLGREIVTALIQNKAKVVATDLSKEELEDLKRRFKWPEDDVDLHVCDVRNTDQIKELFKSVYLRFGQINQLINNAGVSVFEPYLERPDSSIEWVMNVNIKGTISFTREFIKHRIENGGGGEIVNIASHYGLISPDPRIYTDCERKNSEVYGATKAGIIQMTRYYAVNASEHKIRVNSISPGGIRNPDSPQGEDFQNNYSFRCPVKRMAETEEIIGPILFLLSPGASYINGHNLVVDGGMTSW
jgi:NAD(P)-dependent dehydrogenase (short-subunit alcohol dehydrogenase family)